MIYVSAMQYYAYQLYDRPGNFLVSWLWAVIGYGRLFHQYIIDMYSEIEASRLNFFRFNQETIRADLYQNIHNAALTSLGYKIGKRIVLPATLKGSPRHFNNLFQDAMAVIRE